MKKDIRLLLRRIPWRLLIALVGGALVVKGGTQLLSVELPADSDREIQFAKQGFELLIAGGVVLIASFMFR